MNNSNLNIQEDAKSDWMNIVKKHKRKQKGLPALTTLNAGNVEHNVSMFNKVSSPVEGPSNNPVSGPFGDGAVGESLNNSTQNETVELYYKNLEFTYYGESRSPWDWDESDVKMDWYYEVDKDDLYTFIYEDCIDESDFPEGFEDSFNPSNKEDWAKFESWLDDNFDAIYNKYEAKILENWEEDAQEDAASKYDPDDYVNWDSMPGGHDDDRYWKYEMYNKKSNSVDDKFDMSMRTLL